jgi:hypothetical protein
MKNKESTGIRPYTDKELKMIEKYLKKNEVKCVEIPEPLLYSSKIKIKGETYGEF